MTLLEFFKNLSMSGWVSLVVVVGTLVEIAPVKINPIAWFGRHLNAETYNRIAKIETKLDDHIAQSYRTKILMFQDSLLMKGCESFTQEQYYEVLEAISEYEKHCEDNHIKNDKCRMAVSYIERCYKKCLNNQSFANLPN